MTSLMSSDDLDALNTPIEGEVVEPRRRERNEGRSAEILPPDVESKVTALRTLGGESQARSVTVMLNHARTGLLTAIAAQDLPGIVEYKQKAHAITEISKQLRLGKELQLDAAEFLRRAERGLGVAIREGQANGTVETRSDAASRASIERDIKLGRSTKSSDDIVDKTKIVDLLTRTEQSGGRSADCSVFAMTDNVSDQQFDEAIDESKSEGNLSRANVARKAKAKAKHVISEGDPLIDADIDPAPNPTVNNVITPEQVDEIKKPKPRPFKKSDSEMLAEISGSLRNFADLISYIDANHLTADDVKPVIQALTALGGIRKQLKEIKNHVQA